MKTMTLQDLNEALKNWDEVYLIETLGLRSEEIVNRCQDLIEEKFEELVTEVEEMPSIYDEDEDLDEDSEYDEIQEPEEEG